MEVADRQNNLGRIELDHRLSESLLRLEDLVKLTTLHEGHNEIKACWRLEQVVHTDQVRVVTAQEDIFFKLRVLHLIILNEHVFADGFDCVHFLGTAQLRQENFTEGTPA
jgi:hypothetical protein